MFTNEYLMDKNMYKEFVMKISFKVMLIVCLVYIAICTFFLFMTYDPLFLVCDFFIVILLIVYPIILVNKLYKRALEMNCGKQEKTIVTISDKIYLDEGKNHLEFELSQVRKVQETKNFLFLRFQSKSGILIYKDGFTTGTLAEFKEFIKIKGLY